MGGMASKLTESLQEKDRLQQEVCFCCWASWCASLNLYAVSSGRRVASQIELYKTSLRCGKDRSLFRFSLGLDKRDFILKRSIVMRVARVRYELSKESCWWIFIILLVDCLARCVAVAPMEGSHGVLKSIKIFYSFLLVWKKETIFLTRSFDTHSENILFWYFW